MRRLLSICLPLLCLAAATQGAPARSPAASRAPTQLRPITRAESVLAVYRENWGLASSGGPYLILAFWPDGTVVWSEDRLRGGPPYREGRVAPTKIAALFKQFERAGIFGDSKLAEDKFGPDSQFTVLYLKHGAKQLQMRSWHELQEASGDWVGTAGSSAFLNGRSRAEVLRKEPPEFLYYRMVWSEVRAALSEALPAGGTPSSGKPYMRGGELSWQLTSTAPIATPVYTPQGGYVPDAETAIRIAEAVSTPIYGQAQIQREKPFHAVLSKGVWTVTGTLPRGKAGGVALAEISRKDGRVLRVIHGK